MPDQIEFRVEDGSFPIKGVSILINGESLIARLRRHEMPLVAAEGSSQRVAGDYAGVPAAVFRQDHADAIQTQTNGKPFEALQCTCGIAGCWPMEVKIRSEPGAVIWSDFAQPHRRGTWDYSSFGPFCFDEAQYWQAFRTFFGES